MVVEMFGITRYLFQMMIVLVVVVVMLQLSLIINSLITIVKYYLNLKFREKK